MLTLVIDIVISVLLFQYCYLSIFIWLHLGFQPEFKTDEWFIKSIDIYQT